VIRKSKIFLIPLLVLTLSVMAIPILETRAETASNFVSYYNFTFASYTNYMSAYVKISGYQSGGNTWVVTSAECEGIGVGRWKLFKGTGYVTYLSVTLKIEGQTIFFDDWSGSGTKGTIEIDGTLSNLHITGNFQVTAKCTVHYQGYREYWKIGGGGTDFFFWTRTAIAYIGSMV